MRRINCLMGVLTVLLMLSLCLLVCGCGNESMTTYYADKDNYITAVGTVSHIFNDEDERVLYIAFDALSSSFDDNNFKVTGENYDAVVENGIMEVLQLGVQMEFATAPRYFGDGYVMPIVAVKINEVDYLNFEKGFSNFTGK